MAFSDRRLARKRRPVALRAAVAAATATALGACGTSTVSQIKDPRSLAVQFVGAPISLNPALGGNGGSAIFTALDYDPLIYLSNDGKLVPDLATSWRYVGEGNRVFRLKLRPGVTFSDGNKLTAGNAVRSMRYFLKAGGALVSDVGDIASIGAVGPMTVEVRYRTPNPDAAQTMTQYHGIGSLIGPAGLAKPGTLLTSSDGAGAYGYDAGRSVANSEYVYRKNPKYFNPKAQKYASVTVRIIADAHSVLSAAQTAQVAVAAGDASTADAAKSAGLRVLNAPFFNWNLNLADTRGVIAKPLADPRVRQAIALCLNREQLANAFGPDYTKPSGQALLPGAEGYAKPLDYPYDLARAKSLMKQAGYAKGFDLTVLTQSLLDPNTTYSQAVAQELRAIGIRVTLKVDSASIPQFIGDANSKKYAAIIWPSSGTDMYQLYSQISRGIFNPFQHTDARLESILRTAFATSDRSRRVALYQEASRRYQQLAWNIPMFATPDLLYVNPDVSGARTSVQNPNPLPEAPVADLAWQPS